MLPPKGGLPGFACCQVVLGTLDILLNGQRWQWVSGNPYFGVLGFEKGVPRSACTFPYYAVHMYI